MRKYLSYSQINTWQKSKSEYIKRYFEDQPIFETKYLIYGKQFSERLENRDVDTEYLDEWEIQIEREIEWVPCLWFIDSGKSDLSEIIEYKTSVNPWTQEMANNHLQLWMYATMIQDQYWIIPKCSLIWHETIENTDWNIVETWLMKRYDVTISQEMIEKTKEIIKNTWREISEAYENWKKAQQDIVLLNEYAEIAKEIKKLTERQEEIKEALNIPEQWIYIEWLGTFYWTERKKYKYSDNITKKEKEIKEMKKEEEKNMTPEISKSLWFRISK